MLNIIEAVRNGIKDMNTVNCTIIDRNGKSVDVRLSKSTVESLKNNVDSVTGFNVRGKAENYVFYL